MTIADILAEHDMLCMDDADDRSTLAAALRLGLAEALDELVNRDETTTSQTYGIVVAHDFILDMAD